MYTHIYIYASASPKPGGGGGGGWEFETPPPTLRDPCIPCSFQAPTQIHVFLRFSDRHPSATALALPADRHT